MRVKNLPLHELSLAFHRNKQSVSFYVLPGRRTPQGVCHVSKLLQLIGSGINFDWQLRTKRSHSGRAHAYCFGTSRPCTTVMIFVKVKWKQ